VKLMQSFFGAAPTLTPVAQAVAQAEPAISARPWQPVNVRAIGGLTALGFARSRDVLLVTSQSGQSVMDGTTGEIMYRNRDADGLDTSALKGTRLDHPADERFDMVGLYGGALRTMTDDGWSIEKIATPAGVQCLLQPPKASIHFADPKWNGHGKDATFYLMGTAGDNIRAFGFSCTGRILALATSGSLTLWSRPAPLSLS
jgi:hypothetical protein